HSDPGKLQSGKRHQCRTSLSRNHSAISACLSDKRGEGAKLMSDALASSVYLSVETMNLNQRDYFKTAYRASRSSSSSRNVAVSGLVDSPRLRMSSLNGSGAGIVPVFRTKIARPRGWTTNIFIFFPTFPFPITKMGSAFAAYQFEEPCN